MLITRLNKFQPFGEYYYYLFVEKVYIEKYKAVTYLK